MPKKRDEVSEEEAIRRAKEALGDEKIAELQALPPESREAFLQALRLLVAAPQDPPRNRGGRPPGSGKMDLTPAFRRMAELQDADSTLKDRPAALLVSEEMRSSALLHVSPETLRKEFRKVREQFMGEIREQRRPRPRRVASVVVGSPPPTGTSAADHFWGLASAVEEARRMAMGPDIEKLKAMLGPSEAEKATLLRPWETELAKLTAATGGFVPLTIAAEAERLLRGPDWKAAEERHRRISIDSLEEAIRGLDILLGKKPPG
jgi:hypothetical protein